MKKKRLHNVGFLLLCFLASCYGTVGKNFDSSLLKNIQNNVTSQEEIVKKFGVPFKVGTENGQTIWSYQFDRWNAMRPAQSKDLVIRFDRNSIVKAYRYTTSNTKKH